MAIPALLHVSNCLPNIFFCLELNNGIHPVRRSYTVLIGAENSGFSLEVVKGIGESVGEQAVSRVLRPGAAVQAKEFAMFDE